MSKNRYKDVRRKMHYGHRWSSSSKGDHSVRKMIEDIEKTHSNISIGQEFEIFFSHDNDKPKINQVLDYKNEGYAPDDDLSVRIRHVYEVVSAEVNDEAGVREKMEGGGSLIVKGDIYYRAIIRRIEDDYVPKMSQMLEGKLSDIIFEMTNGWLKEGKFCINKDGDYAKVLSISTKLAVDNKPTNDDELRNPLAIDRYKEVIEVKYKYEQYEYLTSIQTEDFDAESTLSIDEFLGKWMPLEEEIDKFNARIEMIDKTKELGAGEQKLIGSAEEPETSPNDNTAVISVRSKEYLEATSKKIEMNKDRAELIVRGINRTLNKRKAELEREVAKQKALMEVMLKDLHGAIAIFKKKMEKIHRLIATLEIYLGVGEKVIQIAEGESAPEDMPISLRQMTLYMDEEFGDPRNGGLDFKNVKDFDKWIIDSGKYDTCLPEKKGVVVFGVRRHRKDYGETDARIAAEWNTYNAQCYVLIRNGDNIYRILSEHIYIVDRLFPRKKELQEMFDQMNELVMKQEETDSEYTYNRLEDEKDAIEKNIFYYKKNMLLIQGLMVRTEIFAPIPPDFNIFNMSHHKGMIEFIYDDENLLPSGRIPFRDWQKEINEKLKKGSRAIVAVGGNRKDWKSRFTLSNLYHEHNIPKLPDDDVYVVKEYETEARVSVYKEILKSDFREAQKSKKKRTELEKHYRLDNPKKCQADEDAGVRTYTGFNHGPEYSYTHFYEIDDHCKYLLVRAVDENGYDLRETRTIKKLRISYNPKDRVNPGWGKRTYGEWDHERKTNLSFIIYKSDDFVLNYDQMMYDDIMFYLNDRVERRNYLSMMPVLYKIRDIMEEEMAQEQQFVEWLDRKLRFEIQELKDEHDVPALIKSALQWYKDEIVVWKRPITSNEAQACRMVEQETRRLIRDKFNFKKLDTLVDNTKKTLAWKPKDKSHSTKRHTFVAIGITKKQFVEQMINYNDLVDTWSNRYMEITKAGLNREIVDVKTPNLEDAAKEHKGKVVRVDEVGNTFTW